MYMIKTILLATAMTVSTLCLCAQKQELTLLKGHVTNQVGMPIAGAKVVVYYIIDYKPFATATTDGEGSYNITFVTENAVSDFAGYFISVDVSAEGCATYTRQEDPLVPLFMSGKASEDFMLYDAMTFKAGEQSSIVLPVTPDPAVGFYYRLSGLEHKCTDTNQHRPLSQLTFTRVMEPRANVPYLFIPTKEYTIYFDGLNLTGTPESISLGDSVWFASSFTSQDMELPSNYSILQLGNSPCCHQPNDSENAYRVGPCHGYIILKNGYNYNNDLSIVLEESDNPKNNKCATPTIAYDKGRLVFSCETPGAECVYEIKCSDEGNGRGNEVNLSQTYEIRVYATLEGRYDSDVATATIGWRNGRPVMEGFSSARLDGDGSCDVNGDGTVDVADIAKVIDSMAGQTGK